METKIISQEKNPFLEREEIKLFVKADSTPRIDEIKKEIGKDAGLIVVNRVNSNFGKQEFFVDLFVYDNLEAKEKIEVIPKKVRKKMAEEKKANEEVVRESKKAEDIVKDKEVLNEEVKE